MVLQRLAGIVLGWFRLFRSALPELDLRGIPEHRPLRDAIAALQDEPTYSSFTVGIVLRNQPGVVYTHSHGGMSPHSLVRIYSMTKPITSLALLQLVQDGRVSLDDPLSRHLPEFAAPIVRERGAGDERPSTCEPTLKHLLTHTSGLGYGDLPPRGPEEAVYQDLCQRTDDKEIKNLAHWARELAKLPLLADPGTEFRYSFSTDVVGRVVEKVCSDSTWPREAQLSSCLQRSVLNPLGMTDTSFAVEAAELHRLAPLYRAEYIADPECGSERQVLAALHVLDAADAQSMWVTPQQSAIESGGGGAESVQGGLVSSLRDYCRLCSALLHRGVSPETGHRLLRPDLAAKACFRDYLPDVGLQPGGWRYSLLGSVEPRQTERRCSDDARAAQACEEEGELGGGFGWSGMAGTWFTVSDEGGYAVVFLSQVRGVDGRVARPLKAALKKAVGQAVADGAFGQAPAPS